MRQTPLFTRALLVLLPGLAGCQVAAPASPASSPTDAAATTPALPYDLPRAAEWTNVDMTFVVAIANNGTVTIDGQTISSVEQMRALAAEARKQSPDLRAVIQADALTMWRSVLRTMDLLKQAGVEKVAFGVTPDGQTSSVADQPNSARLGAGYAWDCKFPPASDAAGIDEATVVLAVAVGVDGAPKWVQIMNDPGHGFGMAAAQCAMSKRYSPGRDEDGQPVPAKTPPIRVKYVR